MAAELGAVENHLDRQRIVDFLLAAIQRAQPGNKDYKLARGSTQLASDNAGSIADRTR